MSSLTISQQQFSNPKVKLNVSSKTPFQASPQGAKLNLGYSEPLR